MFSFLFKTQVATEILAKCDLCHHKPCKNGAQCSPLPNRDYKVISQKPRNFPTKLYFFHFFQCSCTPGFYGKNCDATIDACYGNPCVNGAKCNVVEAGRFE